MRFLLSQYQILLSHCAAKGIPAAPAARCFSSVVAAPHALGFDSLRGRSGLLGLVALAMALVVFQMPAHAQQAHSSSKVISQTSWEEEWDPRTRSWVRISDDQFGSERSQSDLGQHAAREEPASSALVPVNPTRLVPGVGSAAGRQTVLQQFGPFRVLDLRRAAIIGATDASSPSAFKQMMSAWPEIEVLEFVDASGTTNDIANLKLGRAIRSAGISTYIPPGGSARSGAVELFLAGTRRSIAKDTWFAVHSWRDEAGREPRDFAPDAPENRLYLDYYVQMGMSIEDARAFYAMTNSVPHNDALWIKGAEMGRWITEQPAMTRERRIAAVVVSR